MRVPRTQYSREFTQEAVRLVTQGYLSPEEYERRLQRPLVMAA